MENGTASLRTRDNVVHGELQIPISLLKSVKNEIQPALNRPIPPKQRQEINDMLLLSVASKGEPPKHRLLFT